MKRVWHPYWAWEDYKNGMWRSIDRNEKRVALINAIDFTGNAEIYGSWMLKVAHEWPIACEHNLTERSMNRRAWIGHAAACMAIGVPEDVTREAWAELTQTQRDEADQKAEEAIKQWEIRYKQKSANTSRLGRVGVTPMAYQMRLI